MAIQLREALTLMEDTLRPFDIEFVTFDETRKTGGEKIALKNCVQVGASHNRKKNDTVMVKQVDRDAHPYPVHIHLITQVNGQFVWI